MIDVSYFYCSKGKVASLEP